MRKDYTTTGWPPRLYPRGIPHLEVRWPSVRVDASGLRHALSGTLRRPSGIGNATRFYQYRFTRAELARELARGGFEVVEVTPIHKRSATLRRLHHGFGLPYEWRLTRGMAAGLAPLLPGGLIAHMVMAVARKPADRQ